MHRRSLLVHLPAELGEESEFSLIWCCSAGGRPRSTLALIWRSLRRQRPERCNRLLKLTRFIAEPRWECLCVRGCRCVSVWDKRRKKDERGEKGEWAASVNTAGYPLWKSGSWFFFTEQNILTPRHASFTVAERHTSARRHTAGASLLLWVLAGKCCRAQMEIVSGQRCFLPEVTLVGMLLLQHVNAKSPNYHRVFWPFGSFLGLISALRSSVCSFCIFYSETKMV